MKRFVIKNSNQDVVSKHYTTEEVYEAGKKLDRGIENYTLEDLEYSIWITLDEFMEDDIWITPNRPQI